MEPLNLVKRKNRPVAVVAPSTVVSPPIVAAATAPVFPSSLLSSLYVNSVLNDQLFQRAAAAAQYGTSFWTPANRFWQVMQQHNSAAQHYAAAAAAAAAASTSSSSSTTSSSTSSSSSSSATATATAAAMITTAIADCNDDNKRSVSPLVTNSCLSTIARLVFSRVSTVLCITL